jgi:flagellar biosynthetic protein FliQ
MTAEMIIALARNAMETTLLISAPLLLSGLVIGLMVSIFQAVTQIQEMTLTFIPKIVAVFLALLIFFPWMLEIMTSFTTNMFNKISEIM